MVSVRSVSSRIYPSHCRVARPCQLPPRQINAEGHGEANEPCVAVKVREERRYGLRFEHFHLDQKSRQTRQRARDQRQQRHNAEAVREAIFAIRFVKCDEIKFAPSPDEVVRDEDSANRPEQRAVSDEPREDVAVGVCYELLRHH